MLIRGYIININILEVDKMITHHPTKAGYILITEPKSKDIIEISNIAALELAKWIKEQVK